LFILLQIDQMVFPLRLNPASHHVAFEMSPFCWWEIRSDAVLAKVCAIADASRPSGSLPNLGLCTLGGRHQHKLFWYNWRAFLVFLFCLALPFPPEFGQGIIVTDRHTLEVSCPECGALEFEVFPHHSWCAAFYYDGWVPGIVV